MNEVKLTFQERINHNIQKYRGIVIKENQQLMLDVAKVFNTTIQNMSQDNNLGYRPGSWLFKPCQDNICNWHMHDRLRLTGSSIISLNKDLKDPQSDFTTIRTTQSGIRVDTRLTKQSNDNEIETHEFLLKFSKLLYNNKELFNSYFTNVNNILSIIEKNKDIIQLLDNLEKSLKN